MPLARGLPNLKGRAEAKTPDCRKAGGMMTRFTRYPVSTSASSHRQRGTVRKAFSLIELIVGIAIVSVLMAIALPAVQAMREASRNSSCKNHLRQMSLGILQHESKTGYILTGGWSPLWLGVAERTADGRQPGGWTYNILPYIEELGLHSSVEGVTSATAESAYQTLAVANVPMFNCPSRRHVNPLPIDMTSLQSSTSGSVVGTSSGTNVMFAGLNSGGGNGGGSGGGNTYFRTAVNLQVSLSEATRTDYAANGGSYGVCFSRDVIDKFGHINLAHKVLIGHNMFDDPDKCVETEVSWDAFTDNRGHAGHSGHHYDRVGGCPNKPSCTNPIDSSIYTPGTVADGDLWYSSTTMERLELADSGIPDLQDGVITRMGRIASAKVLDGMGNVYLLGEKYVAADHYQTGKDPGDAGVLYSGYSSSNIRWGSEPPKPDTADEFHNNSYGSAHAGGFNMAFGDGRIETFGFDIDPAVHRALAGRANGSLPVMD
jgi:prepilin-type N-terminal cleavage/methylation domain-containing protein/prepilin-type processing-associated H-X9-DG protein